MELRYRIWRVRHQHVGLLPGTFTTRAAAERSISELAEQFNLNMEDSWFLVVPDVLHGHTMDLSVAEDEEKAQVGEPEPLKLEVSAVGKVE